MKGNDIMGKKDEEIARLNAINEKLKRNLDEDTELIKELEAKKKGLTEQNQRLGDKMDKDREAYAERLKKIEVDSKEALEEIRKEFEHLDNIKTPLDLEVNVTGINDAKDISDTLNKAVTLMEDRFEKLGLGGKYNIIAHPHTMKLGLLA